MHHHAKVHLYQSISYGDAVIFQLVSKFGVFAYSHPKIAVFGDLTQKWGANVNETPQNA